ncbi:MAG: hypothetical protein ACJAV1_003402, partial [Paraglaciecola sp.]
SVIHKRCLLMAGICPFLPDQHGLQYGKTSRTPFKFVCELCAISGRR